MEITHFQGIHQFKFVLDRTTNSWQTRHKNSSVPHIFSFLASQRKACGILEIRSYCRVTVDGKSIIVGAHIAGQSPHLPIPIDCVMQKVLCDFPK